MIIDNVIMMISLAQAQGSSSLWSLLLPMGVMFLIIYFLVLYPQKKKQKETQKMLSELKKNDKAVTAGGIHGIVKSVSEKEVVLVVDDSNKIKMTFSRDAIARVYKKDDEEGLQKQSD